MALVASPSVCILVSRSKNGWVKTAFKLVNGYLSRDLGDIHKIASCQGGRERRRLLSNTSLAVPICKESVLENCVGL